MPPASQSDPWEEAKGTDGGRPVGCGTYPDGVGAADAESLSSAPSRCAATTPVSTAVEHPDVVRPGEFATSGPGAVLRIAAVVGLVGAAVAAVAVEPWHGVTFLAVTDTHGVDTGDAVVLPLLVAGVWLALGSPSRRERLRHGRGPLVSIAPAVFGAALVIVTVVDLGLLGRPGDLVVTGGFVASAGWFLVATVLAPATWLPPGGHALLVATATFVTGSVVDAVFPPTGTVFGPLLLATFLAFTATPRRRAMLLWLVVGALLAANVASIVDIADVDVLFARSEGARIRAGTLGVVLLTAATGVVRRE